MAGAEISVTGASSGIAFNNTGGIFSANGGTVAFTSSIGQRIQGLGSTPFHHVRVANTVAVPSTANDVEVFSGTLSVTGTLTVEDGMATWRDQVGNVDLQADGLLNLSSVLNVSGNWTKAAAGLFTPNTFTVLFNGSGAQAINGATTFAGLQIQNTAPVPSDSAAVVASAPVTTLGSLLVNDGQFNVSDGSSFGHVGIEADGILKAPASGTISVTDAVAGVGFACNGTLIANSGTVVFPVGGVQEVLGAATFHDVRTNRVDSIAGAGIVVAGTLHVDGGNATGWRNLNNVVIAPSGTLDAGSHTVTVSGNIDADGVLDADSASFLFEGTGVQEIESNGVITFGNLSVAASAILNERGPIDRLSVSGTLTNDGILRRTRIVTGPGPVTGGLTGAVVDFVASGTVTDLVIDRIDSVPNGTADHVEPRSWTFAAVGSGYDATLTLPHALAVPSQATVSRYLGSGTDWDFVQDGVTATTVTRNGVTDLSSRWAVANRVGTGVSDWNRLED